MKLSIAFLLFFLISFCMSRAYAQSSDMGQLLHLKDARTRSISPENFTGEKGKGGMATLEEGSAAHAARELGQGWKVNPYIHIEPGETFTLGEIHESGIINHIWMTPVGDYRLMILRFYWDDETEPSVEVPVGDFFAAGWGMGQEPQIASLAVCVNPKSGFNAYWQMPFRKGCLVTMENLGEKKATVYYQITYSLETVSEDTPYFHAQFRRMNTNTTSDYPIIDGIKGKGHFVGVCMAWGVNNNGWWGEGEIKFFIDGDTKFPTICGTGTEDYFCGSYNFDRNGKYTEFCTPYSGLHQVIRPDGTYRSQQRFGLYRWHIMDPVRFDRDLRITIQDLGWRQGGRYLKQQSDIASVCFWYQSEPHARFPKLPGWQQLEVN